MSKFEIMPFATHTVDVRVVQSPIGAVTPVVDIARAIGYESWKLTEILDRYPEQFEETVATVTVGSVFEQKSAKGKVYQRQQDVEVPALNAYGVVGLLMKLDYSRIQDEDKRASVLRFQRWAMKVLGDHLTGKPVSAMPRVGSRRIDGFEILPDGVEAITTTEAGEMLGIDRASVQKRIERGVIKAYKARGYNGTRYAIPVSEIERIMTPIRKLERKIKVQTLIPFDGHLATS